MSESLETRLWVSGRCSLEKTTSRKHGALSIRRLKRERQSTSTNRAPGGQPKRTHGSNRPEVGTIRRRQRQQQFHMHLQPETTQASGGIMRIEVLTDADAVARKAATLIAAEARQAVAAGGRFVMAVSGGHTPWVMLR